MIYYMLNFCFCSFLRGGNFCQFKKKSDFCIRFSKEKTRISNVKKQ